MLEEGTMAPDFTLTADDGRQVSLADFRGQKVILYFYPKADTPGCTKQACAIRDVYPDIDGQGAVVIGISPDPPEKLVKFREKHNLPFILLSDPDHQVAEAYGAWGEKKMYGKTTMGIIRSHFGIDEEGRLMEMDLKVKPETTAELALRLIRV
ncbi:MAG: thioredoxin-dependent thiol peroxidase [Anaerolineae bacterium]|jgi:peroxiredoxin Q/BCP|nr:thioredoxin-dependent thiol peroxidase [Anaerolineae bacterium]MDH7475702.1 thioredoxin-dependent thiol peroxidase [Anaerolineae bacterium]